METVLKDDCLSACTGCSACFSICPVEAISMESNLEGFVYPSIHSQKCIHCNLCRKVCPVINEVKGKPLSEVYAAITKIDNLEKCASGGVFSAIATYFLSRGGVVIGCAMDPTEKGFNVHHILITKQEDLNRISGSKYVQSSIGATFRETKKWLDAGKMVLFSGTPCQIAGLKSYLRKDYNNLYCCDIICHGVPSLEMFNAYLHYLEKGKQIESFVFRDKSCKYSKNGVGLIKYSFHKNKQMISKNLYHVQSSYYTLFLNSEINRECCYHCQYAKTERIGDFTLGDFWGYENLANRGIDSSRGISFLGVNSLKGKMIFKELRTYIQFEKRSIEEVLSHNEQLTAPALCPLNRERVLDLYRNEGWKGVEKWFRFSRGLKNLVKTTFPKELIFYILSNKK